MSIGLNDADLIITNRAKLLENIIFFRDIKQPHLLELAGLMKQTSVKKNNVIINQGDLSRSLFVIVYGRLKVFANDDEGNQTLFTFMNAGDYFGELSLLDDAPRSATVTAIEDCTFLVLDHKLFIDFINAHPSVCWSLFRSLTRTIRIMDETICSLSSNDIYGRLVVSLYKLANETPEGMLITPKLTQQDLAEMIGSSREMISRIFRDLKQRGYISIEKKQISILKRLPTQH